MSKVLYFVTFAAGAVIGFAAAYKIAEKKYEQIAQEEIESVKKTFNDRYGKADEPCECKPTESTKEKISDDIIEEYKEIAKSYGTPTTKKSGPYIITPDEFGEIGHYELVELTYYSDGVLAYNDGREIEDIEGLLGIDPSDHFGEYEDDSVFVRDDSLQTDYEILLDSREYSEGNK